MNKQKPITILLIAGLISTIIGGTFAYWGWATANNQKTEVTFTVASDFSCSGDAGGNITSNDKTLAPASCLNTNYAIQRTVRVNTSQPQGKSVALDMWLKVNSIAANLSASENFKYALTTNSGSCTEDVIAEGTFTGSTAGSQLNLLEKKEYTETTSNDTYYLYIWLDAAETNPNTMNQTFNFSVEGSCTNRIVEDAAYADFGNHEALFKVYPYYDNITAIEFVNYTNTDGLNNINTIGSVAPSYIPSNFNNFSVSKMSEEFDTKFLLGVTNTEKIEHLAANSAERTADVVGWLEEDPNDSGNYTLKIGTNASKIYARNLSNAFSNLQHVKTINNLNMLDTSKTVNMSYMFYEMVDMRSFNIGNNFDTRNVTNMSWMFYSFAASEEEPDLNEMFELNLGSKFDAGNVTDITGFISQGGKYHSFISSINLGNNFNASKVTNMSEMFYDLCDLVTLDLGNNFNASNVTNMSQMFYYLDNLTTLNFGNNFNASNVNTPSMYMFTGLNNLTTLNLGNNFNISKATETSAMFDSFPNLISINLGNNFNASNVTNIVDMFTSLPNLTTLDFGNNFNANNVTDMSYMFFDVPNLITLNLGNNFNSVNVTSMEGMFYGLSNLANLDAASVDFTNMQEYDDIFMDVPNTARIYVKDAANRSWVINKGNNFSAANVLIK